MGAAICSEEQSFGRDLEPEGTNMRSISVIFVVTAFLMAGVSQAKGASITYVQTVADASGTLGGVSFSGVLLTFTSTGDTNNVFQMFPLDYFNYTTSTVAVPGIGTATFTDPVYVFDNQPSGKTGFGDYARAGDVLQEVDPRLTPTT